MNRLVLNDVTYYYSSDKMVLNHMNFTFEDSKIYAICGKSGAGKTTLLSLLSQLTQPKEGTIWMDGKPLSEMDPYEYRSQQVGIIFQNFNLLPQLNAIENVTLAMEIAKMKGIDKKQQANLLLQKVGIEESDRNRKILKLSGGQQQRVAIARALAYDPKILLADEPTGNLDEETQSAIMELFQKAAYEDHKCVILVTHSKQVAQIADQIYYL